MNATGRITDLIEITERLEALLTKENKALSDRDAKEATLYLDEKNSLSRIYESRIKGITDNPAALAEVEPELRNTLREQGEKVNLMIQENAQLLKITIEANRRVVEMVAEAVKSQQPGPGTYSAKGTSNKVDVHSAPRNLALSLDRSL
jgi:hypothetical protein